MRIHDSDLGIVRDTLHLVMQCSIYESDGTVMYKVTQSRDDESVVDSMSNSQGV